MPEIMPMLKEYFDVLKNCLKELEKKQITDYVTHLYILGHGGQNQSVCEFEHGLRTP